MSNASKPHPIPLPPEKPPGGKMPSSGQEPVPPKDPDAPNQGGRQ